MNPQQPYSPPEQPLSIDYLNQISGSTKRRPKIPPILLWGGIGVLLLIFILVISSITRSSSGPNLTVQNQQLLARMQGLQKVSKQYHQYLRSNDAQNLDSNFQTYLTNAFTQATTPMLNNHIKVDKLNDAIKKASAVDMAKITDELEDARLNSKLDSTYAREMSYQMELLMNQMKQIYTKTESKSLKTYLDSTYKDGQVIQKQFADFSATSE